MTVAEWRDFIHTEGHEPVVVVARLKRYAHLKPRALVEHRARQKAVWDHVEAAEAARRSANLEEPAAPF